MAARGGAVFQQEQRNRGGVKVKAAVPGEPRNRRALQDIGNLAKTQALLDGKPQIATRPLTRNFAAQLLRKAQEGAEKTKVALVPEAIKINAACDAKVAVVPEAINAAREAKVAVIEKKVLTISHEEVKNKKPKDEIKTLTSLLTARSKVVCGELAKQKPKVQHIQNIDESDIGNEFAEIEYVDDIYNYYKVTEDENRVGDYMCLQPDINVMMRAILIDWLIEVHNKFELTPETLYLTVNIVDRYLMMKTVARRELQLVGMSAMLIACKYEEIWAPEGSLGVDWRNMKGQILASAGSSSKQLSRKQFGVDSTSMSDSKSTEASTSISLEELGAVDSATSMPSTSRGTEAIDYSRHPSLASSALVELTTRLDFFKERRSQLMEQLHGLDLNYGTATSQDLGYRPPSPPWN